MNGTAIKELERINLERLQVERDGLLFSGLKLNPVFYQPRPDAVELHTLSGLVDFVQANIDSMTIKEMLLSVDSPLRVVLMSKVGGYDRKRDIFATATVDREMKTFEFGKYMTIESFIVSLRSMFEPTTDIERLINYVSKVRGGKSFSLEDDGISQTASVTVGASGALTQKETAPAIIKLRPYRTFRDIEQTESEFLFRMKLIDVEENVVGACMYEADGGRWRNTAAIYIRDYLYEKLTDYGLTVIA